MAEKADIEQVPTTEERRPSTTIEDLKKTTTLDTLHNDEAVKVLATYAGDETWTPAEEKRVVKQIDRRLLPLLVLTYGLQYYDKAMLSQAVCIPVAQFSPSLAERTHARTQQFTACVQRLDSSIHQALGATLASRIHLSFTVSN